jgi:hypothetical protein
MALFDGLDPFSEVNSTNRAKGFWELEVPSVKDISIGPNQINEMLIPLAMAEALKQMIETKIHPADPTYLQRVLNQFGKTSIDKIQLMHQSKLAASISAKIEQLKSTQEEIIDF